MSDTDRETPKIARGATREVAVWDGLARHYDLIVRALGARYDAAAARMRTIIAGKARVIEIAAGTGLFTREIAKVAVQVVATDFSASMLAMIDKRLASERITNVQTFQRDACNLGFPSETFDAAVCANALHVIPEPVAALREIHRVLAPGGVLVAPTFCHGETAVSRSVSRLLSAVSAFRAYTRFTTASLRAMIEEQRFAVRICDDLGGLLPLVYVEARRR